jgi:glycosyltransferase involved in cell wall biosynthesis
MAINQKRHLTVSVILPTYNRADLVALAVESVLQQTRPANQVIVVDDGSTDDTRRTLRRFGRSIDVISQPNRGLSAARNRGIAQAAGDVLLFLDSDDLLMPNCIDRSLQVLEERPEVDVVYSDCRLIDRAGNQLGVMSQVQPGKRPSGRILAELGYRWFFLNISSSSVRRSALRDIEFDESLSSSAEDFEFWRRLAVESRFFYVDEILSCYRHHDSQITATRVVETLDGAIEVQRRIMEMPEFQDASRDDQARLYCLHGVKHAERGRCDVARKYFLRSLRTSPGHRAAYALLGLSLLGGRPLRYAITKRRKLFGNPFAAMVAQPLPPQ